MKLRLLGTTFPLKMVANSKDYRFDSLKPVPLLVHSETGVWCFQPEQKAEILMGCFKGK